MNNSTPVISNQKGFAPILLILLGGALLLLVVTFVIRSGVFGPHPSASTSDASPSGQVASDSATPTSSSLPSSTATSKPYHSASPVPTPTPTSSPAPTGTPSPTSTATPAPTATATPSPIPAPTPGVNCSISFGNGTNSISGSNPLNATLYYGANYNNAGNDYVSGAQWDFNGDGTWDTDWSLSNGTINHTFTQSSTVKLHVQTHNGLTSDVCAGTVTVN